MNAWPPDTAATPYYLQAGNGLSRTPPTDERATSHYCYDPARPTPVVGGTQFSPWAGQYNNRRLEARSDVLVFTSEPLREEIEVIGVVRMELYVRSSAEYTDFFGRLCDVSADGRSVNVCDGLFRIEPGTGERQPDGSLRIEIDLWATAYRFKRGHSLRVQVSSGAHPRWSRNLGTKNQLHGSEMRPADQTIYHDRLHPSMIVIPTISFA
jgi:putative CocE/NonD family hydrolase